LVLWLVVGLILPGIFLILARVLADNGEGTSVLTVGVELPTKLLSAAALVLATWLVSRRQKRSLGHYGVPMNLAFGWRFWEGCVWGFAMLSFLLLPLYVTGDFRVNAVALSHGAFLRYAVLWALTFLGVSVGEELTFRGYLLYLAARRIRFWPASLALSAGFAIAHIPNPGETFVGILQVAGTGLLLCFTLRRTGNLWFAFGYHAAWDWAQTFFYGTPDSGLLAVGYFLNTSIRGPKWLTGASTGPEGSVLALFVLGLAAALVHVRFPRPVYPDRPE